MIVLRCPRCDQPFTGDIYARPTDTGWQHTTCPRVCKHCDRQLIGQRAWDRLDPLARQRERARGRIGAHSTDICIPCNKEGRITEDEARYDGDWVLRGGVHRPTRPTRRTETAA